MHVAEAPLPDSVQLGNGPNVPEVLFELKLTVPDGVSVPGAVSETVTKHEA